REALQGAGLSLCHPRPAGIQERERQRGLEVDREKVRELLEAVAAGALPPERALARLRDLPVEDLRFARVDLHRSLRHGVPEAVFCQGKTAAQVLAIVTRLAESHDNILATRADAAVIDALTGSWLECAVLGEARLVGVSPRCHDGVVLLLIINTRTCYMLRAEGDDVTDV